ncbi:putative glycogenin glucosyltransferase [Trypanosoma theileri]|uniref:Putative glycogenin glucosyltransferase n=1 Tax=Trypanosoma theileri TaxID=67003 RepID=A0A1X0NYA5_9TRYP|nr:putative glycogenin glucosyltransferase [Trypanosoma theileri]ORC89665.1 putative glycogenin glucosyltransferase [Trypanosoma theileri]
MFGFRKRKGTSSLPISPLRVFYIFLVLLWLVVFLAVFSSSRANEDQNPQQQQQQQHEEKHEKEAEQKDQNPQQQQQEQLIGSITLDLHRITDPVNELVADETFLQLHHGIYRVMSPLMDGSGDFIKFAFKTECRPAALWHGQQGWTEVAFHTFQQLFYEDAREGLIYPKAGLARGVVLAITEKQLEKVVHRDHCGELNEKMIISLEEVLGGGKKLLRGENRMGNQGNINATVLLIGVALTWEDSYDDAVYPSTSVYAPYFTVPPISVKMNFKDIHRFELYEISDVMVFDYLLHNPDRYLKNWFKDKATRTHTILMDNGWAFAGPKFDSSICEVESILLSCPSPLRAWVSRKRSIWRCKQLNTLDNDDDDINNNNNNNNGMNNNTIAKSSKPNVLKWCRFRPDTLVALNRTRSHWHNESYPKGAISKRWLDKLYSDILIAFLLYTYGSDTNHHGFNMALARYVKKGCSLPPSHSHQNPELISRYLLQLLEAGLMARMDRLALHAEKCLQKYGETYVYGFDVKE